MALNSIAPDDGVCGCCGAIDKRHQISTITLLGIFIQPLAEVGTPGRKQLDKFVQEPGTVNTYRLQQG
jgi:hypothetical protein